MWNGICQTAWPSPHLISISQLADISNSFFAVWVYGFIIEAAAKTWLTVDFRYAFVGVVAQCHRTMVHWTNQETLLSPCRPSHRLTPCEEAEARQRFQPDTSEKQRLTKPQLGESAQNESSSRSLVYTGGDRFCNTNGFQVHVGFNIIFTSNHWVASEQILEMWCKWFKSSTTGLNNW